MNDKLIAPCGLDCAACPAYTATVKDDDELRAETAKQWAAHGFTGGPEEVNCLGCMSAEAPAIFSDHCPVRMCVVERGVESCAHCGEFACPTLEKHWDFLGKKDEARANLKTLRRPPDTGG
jgi:hypothetical protein